MDKLGFVVNKIAEALKQMPNLVDLHVRSGRAGEAFKGSITSIGEVIRNGHFQLHTLCLSHYVHDLEGIILSQPNLRRFGVYYHFRLDATVCEKLDRVFQRLLSHRGLVKLFLLHYSKSKDESAAVINMLPFLHRPGEALQACREAEKLTEWPNDFHEASGHSSLSLVGISEENINLLEELMEAMADWVQGGHSYLSDPRLRIHVQHTTIQKPWNFPEFVEPLTLFENVEKLLFYFPDLDKNEWSKIQQIRLWGKESTIMLDRTNEWNVDVGDAINLRMNLVLEGWY
ncbi:hypothetical protein F5887DRAFT_385872 [Amanita rubescens]|nr:hypothetical protein F5887DRAFT_385872 [Amanita rubescens]